MKKNMLTVSMMLLSIITLSLIIVTPTIAITWGEPDPHHTNVAAVLVEYPPYGWFPVCSGTLIHPQVILTAGHFTYGLGSPAEVLVTFDQDASNPFPDTDTRSKLVVAQVITHPDYYWGPQSNPHDVGVLILAEPVTSIEIATLPEIGFLDDLKKARELKKAEFTVVGYGGTLNWPPPDVIYEDERQFAVSEYRALLKSWLRLSQNQATGDGGTSYGDSGGPAFWTESDGTEILVGITSWGDMQTVATGFYYRVDTADTLDFINDVIYDLSR